MGYSFMMLFQYSSCGSGFNVFHFAFSVSFLSFSLPSFLYFCLFYFKSSSLCHRSVSYKKQNDVLRPIPPSMAQSLKGTTYTVNSQGVWDLKQFVHLKYKMYISFTPQLLTWQLLVDQGKKHTHRISKGQYELQHVV